MIQLFYNKIWAKEVQLCHIHQAEALTEEARTTEVHTAPAVTVQVHHLQEDTVSAHHISPVQEDMSICIKTDPNMFMPIMILQKNAVLCACLH